MSPTALGHRLHGLRMQAQISGRELAKLANVSPGYPAHIESGRVVQIGGEIAGRFARVLGCSLEYLLLGTGAPPSDEVVLAAISAASASKLDAEVA